MTVTIARLIDPVPLATNPAILYSVPTDGSVKQVRIDKLTVFNSSGGSATLAVFLVPKRGSPNQMFNQTTNQSIATLATYNSPNEVGHVLNPGDSIQGSGSVNAALILVVSGVIVS